MLFDGQCYTLLKKGKELPEIAHVNKCVPFLVGHTCQTTCFDLICIPFSWRRILGQNR